MTKLEHLSVTLLAPMKGLNTRKNFNEEKGKELRASIREHGVRHALEVIESRETPGVYEIIGGERRWRESVGLITDLTKEIELAEGEEREALRALLEDRQKVPCSIVPEEDREHALVLNLIENLQRDGLSEREEAEGYERLKAMTNPKTGHLYSLKEVASAVGKNIRYISRRLKLKRVPEFFMQAVEKGIVSISHAETIGELPGEAVRQEVADLVLRPRAPAPEQEAPLTVQQTEDLIREHYVVNLSRCGFDTSQADLLPIERDEDGERVAGGACDDCPFRSGNMASLKGELSSKDARGKTAGVDPNRCLNTACFTRKRNAAWLMVRMSAEARGQAVIDGDAALKVFSGVAGGLPFDSPYINIEERPSPQDVHFTRAEVPTWRELLKGCKVAITLARNPFNHAQVELAKKKEAIAAINAKAERDGVKSLFAKPGKAEKPAEAKEEAAEVLPLKAGSEERGHGGNVAALVDACMDKLRAKGGVSQEMGEALLKLMLIRCAESGMPSHLKKEMGFSGIAHPYDESLEALLQWMRADTSATGWWHRLAEVVLGQAADTLLFVTDLGESDVTGVLTHAFGVDVARCWSLGSGE